MRESQGRGQYLGKQSREELHTHGGAAGQSGSKPLKRMAKAGAGGSEVMADWGVKSYLSVIMCAVPGLRPHSHHLRWIMKCPHFTDGNKVPQWGRVSQSL